MTLGGVSTDEVSSKTMESQRSPGLYFVGEVLDVSGHLGGFNFQWAWASGYAAGQYALARLGQIGLGAIGQRYLLLPLSAGWLATSSRNCAATAFFSVSGKAAMKLTERKRETITCSGGPTCS